METDRDNISVRVASFSYYLDNSPPSLVYGKTKSHTSKPPLTATFSRSSKDVIIPSFQVDSFSYNRKPKGEKSVFEAPGPVQDPTRAFCFSHEIPSKEGEIGVFGADKYFGMKLEYQTRAKHDYENQTPIDLIGTESKIKPRTPSLSQSALLSSLHRNEKQKRPVRRRIFTGFNCQGPCFDDSAVRIKDLVLIPSENDPTVDMKKPNASSSDFEESRNSIEVFGSSETNSRSKGSDVAANMERKLSMLTWDAIIPIMRSDQDHQTSTTTAASSAICDDVASDASSDLFEIENVSGTLHPMLKSSKEDESDNVSSCLSPVYAPSESSIQWSVITASAAADYSSAVSEYYNDERIGIVNDDGNNSIRFKEARNVSEKEVQIKSKSSSSSSVRLLGCKSQKAVDVADSNVCCNKKG